MSHLFEAITRHDPLKLIFQSALNELQVYVERLAGELERSVLR